MFDDLKKEKNLFRILLILLIIAVGSYVYGIFSQVLGNFSDIIIILLVAWVLSFVLEPLVDKIEEYTQLSRILATLLTYTLLISIISVIIFLFIPAVTTQIQSFIAITPRYLESSPSYIKNALTNITPILSSSIILIPSVAQFLLSLFLVLIFSFYFIVDKDRINKELFFIIPKKRHEQLRFTQKVISSTFASFLRVQLFFGVITFVATWLILRILDIDFAASTAFMSGVLSLIPMIGPVFAMVPPLFVAFLKDPNLAIIVFTFLLVIQQIVFNVIGPKLLGDAFRLHPVIIILSFLIGLKIAGGMGAMFAIPVIGVLSIILRELSHHFFKPQAD